MTLHEDGESSWVPRPTVPMVPTVRGSTHQRLVIFLQHPPLPIVITLMQSDFLLCNRYYDSYQFSIIVTRKNLLVSLCEDMVSPNVILIS